MQELLSPSRFLRELTRSRTESSSTSSPSLPPPVSSSSRRNHFTEPSWTELSLAVPYKDDTRVNLICRSCRRRRRRYYCRLNSQVAANESQVYALTTTTTPTRKLQTKKADYFWRKALDAMNRSSCLSAANCSMLAGGGGDGDGDHSGLTVVLFA